jgi:hypothetical protein
MERGRSVVQVLLLPGNAIDDNGQRWYGGLLVNADVECSPMEGMLSKKKKKKKAKKKKEKKKKSLKNSRTRGGKGHSAWLGNLGRPC